MTLTRLALHGLVRELARSVVVAVARALEACQPWADKVLGEEARELARAAAPGGNHAAR